MKTTLNGSCLSQPNGVAEDVCRYGLPLGSVTLVTLKMNLDNSIHVYHKSQLQHVWLCKLTTFFNEERCSRDLIILYNVYYICCVSFCWLFMFFGKRSSRLVEKYYCLQNLQNYQTFNIRVWLYFCNSFFRRSRSDYNGSLC